MTGQSPQDQKWLVLYICMYTRVREGFLIEGYIGFLASGLGFRVSLNQGCHFRGAQNKNSGLWGPILGSPCFGKLPNSPKPMTVESLQPDTSAP